MKRLLQASVTLLALLGVVTFMAAPQVGAQQLDACEVNPSSDLCATENNNNTNSYRGVIKNVVNTILFIVGVAAVVMIVVSGLRYVISGGNAQQVQAAKSSLVYAVVGLLVAMFAYGIVNFVLRETTGEVPSRSGGGRQMQLID